jgi:hypothetical protein
MITLYTLNGDKSFSKVTDIPFGNQLQSIAYNPDGSVLLAGG